ncbi:MAG: glycine oxidase ThiO [Acidiferrobacterales bacterium]|nr:glycine oxidase ThiO [Acidiferrobacterales bacterium]
MKHPICIVGGGVIGLLIARELHALGENVMILDRRESGKESSWAGGGILSPLYPWRYPDSVTELARWSQTAYPGMVKELQRDTGIDAEWVRSGLLILGISDTETAVNWARKFAISAKNLESGAIDEIQSGLGMNALDGFWMPDIAQVRNPRLLAALKRDLQKKSIEIVENEAVTGFGIENGELRHIKTDNRTITTDRCIIAAGAWSGDLFAQTGLSIPVKPIRGQMLLYKAKPGLLQRIILKNNRYLIPRRDGRILVGSTLEDVGFDSSTTEAAFQELHETAVEMLPALADVEIEVQWAGLRPGSPAGVPYIGQSPEVKGLYLCSGHFRNGFVLGPASARLVVDLVLGNTPIVDSEPYKIDRVD